MADDGLSGLDENEVTKLLFKNYMNCASTSDSFQFYQENLISNNSNIFGSGLLTDTPPKSPTFIEVTNDVSLSEYLSYSAIPDIDIDSTWFTSKTDSDGNFYVDSTSDESRTILKLEKIKLDYLQSGTTYSSAFVCLDLSGQNILQNLVSFNYSRSGYDTLLYYKYGDKLETVSWLDTKTDLIDKIGDSSIKFGGALLDIKNGVVTFYDVDGEPQNIFPDISCSFYLTVTKYIGKSNVKELRSLEVIGDTTIGNHLQVVGDVSMESNVDISENLHVFNQLNVEKDVSFGSHLQVVGDVSMESSLDINSDLHVKGNSTFGLVSSNVEDVSNNDSNIYLYGDLRIMNGGNLVIEDISNTTVTELRTEVQITDSLDISNDGTSTAMIVSQLHTNNYKIVEFKDAAETVFSVGKNGNTFIQGDVSMESSLEISNNLLVRNQVFVDKDVSFGSHLFVSGDVSFNSTVEISGLMITKKNFVFQTNTTEKMIIDTSGVKILNNDPSYSALDISATSALKIPVGTGAQRPSIETTGQIRYNMTTKQFEGYGDTGGWQGLGGITDLDQDTYILAHDNNEIQIFTASYERMKVDACGNIQIFDSNPTYSALDISATSALQIPVGTQNQRPINSENPGALRFNSDTSLCEVYTESNIWSGLPVYKAEQPPYLHSPSTSEENKSFTISWSKFDEIYRDAYDGKSYPIFLQTYVDVSYSGTSGQWKTIYIGQGNCNTSGNTVTPSLTLSIDDSGFSFDDDAGTYDRDDIDFDEKPNTHDISSFDQNYKFDFRLYAINNSGKTPNYLYIYQVGLKTTNKPSPPEVTSTDTFVKNSFDIDTSFNIDSGDSAVTTSEVTIDHYDISYVLTDTKSFEDRTDSGNSQITHGTKTNITLSNLFPGAVYDFQVQVKNTANSNESGYGDVFTSTDFTNNGTNHYIETGDLNSVTPNNMSFTLNNTKSISGYISDGNGTSITNKTITNENGYIAFSNTSEFYVNYTKQGIDMSGVDNLVQVTVDLEICGNSVSSQTITYDGTNNPSGVSVQTIDVFTPLSDEYFVVTIDDKTNSNPYYSDGSSLAYFLNGVESPVLNFVVGVTYTFDQSDGENGSHPLIFYTSDDKSGGEYDTDVTINGTQGQSGSYTQITITSDTPDILYYQCSAHPYMGNMAQISSPLVYQFSSDGAYTDKATSTSDDSAIGFVYSATFDNSNNTTEASLNEIFVQNFPPSIDTYQLKYTISGEDLNGTTDSYTKTTNNFYVDNYESTPDISWNIDPYLTVDSSSSLFGIPSVLSIRLQGSFDVSGFASYIIPHSNNNHSYVSSISDSGTGYSFEQVSQTGIDSTNTYTFNGGTYNKTSTISSGTYNSSPSIDFSANVHYLDGNSGSDGPTLERYEESKNVTMDSIFKDSVTTYSGYDLYLFDSVNSVLGNQITDFTETPSDISTTLLYFDGSFVSGGYTNSNGVSVFSDWSTGYAVDGPNYSIYSNTGSVGSESTTLFKWVVLKIDNLLSSDGDTVNLSNFKINNATPLVSEFGSVYEAYIGLSINTGSGNQVVFGSLHAAYGAGNTKWYNNDINSISTISNAILVEGAIAPSSSGYAAQVGTVSSGTYSYNGIYLIVGLKSTSTSTFNLNL